MQEWQIWGVLTSNSYRTKWHPINHVSLC